MLIDSVEGCDAMGEHGVLVRQRRPGSEWELEELIGAGGSAEVYRARRSDGLPGALKLMHPQLASSRRWLRRFDREVALLRSHPHPGIAQVMQAGIMDGRPFYVMELLSGVSLETLRSTRGGSLPVDDVLAYADAALEILSFVHAAGIVHRDIKPSNLFLTEEGAIKVLDFGIARGGGSGLQTTAGGILGTPAFMAPEHARGRWDLVDARSDIWSLGATLFYLLSGKHVHAAQTDNERLGLAMVRPARRLRVVAPEVPPAVARVIDRALAYEPEARFQTAAEFRASLATAATAPVDQTYGALRTFSDTATFASSRRWTHRSFWSLGAGFALTGLGGAAVFLLLRQPASARQHYAAVSPQPASSPSFAPLSAAAKGAEPIPESVPKTQVMQATTRPTRPVPRERRTAAREEGEPLLDQRVLDPPSSTDELLDIRE